MEYAASFDPAFASRIEGASSAEIEELERVAGGTFPSDYRAFLELMGRRDDAILGQDDIATSATTLTEFYKEDVVPGHASVPPGFVVFAISGISIGRLFVDRNPPHPVYKSAAIEPGTFWAASFRGLLYQQMFSRAGRRNHTKVLFSVDRAPRLSDAERLLDAHGFERLWFSDEATLCYESDDDKIMIRQIAGRNAKLQVSTKWLFRLWRLVWRLSRELHFPLFPRPTQHATTRS